MKRSSIFVGFGALVLFASPAPAAFAAAAAPSAANGELVVTARRVAENIQKVPVSVVAYTPQMLEHRNFDNLSDVTRLVPAVRFTGSNNAVTGVIEMRGLGNAPTGTAGPAVQLYMDDVPVAGFSDNDTAFDVSNIQVLRGPQGTLFGRNTIGGAVLVDTQEPGFSQNGYVKVSGGNYNYVAAEGAGNITLIPDVAALRLSGQIRVRDGYTTSLGPPGSVPYQGNLNTKKFRATLLLQPTHAFRNVTVFEYFNQHDHGSPSVGTADLATNGNNPYQLFLGFPALAVPAIPATPFPWLDTVRTEYTVINTTTFDVNDSLRFKNIFGFRHSDDRLGLLLNAGPIGRFGANSNTVLSQYTDEAQILGKAFDNRVNWLLGGFYYDSQPSGLAGFGQYLEIPHLGQVDSGNSSYITSKSQAVFANVKWGIIPDKLFLNVGARYTWDQQDICATPTTLHFGWPSSTSVSVSQAQCLALAAVGGPGNGTLHPKSEAPTWTVGLDYQATDNLFFYIVSRRGYRSGGANSAIFNSPCTTGAPSTLAGGVCRPSNFNTGDTSLVSLDLRPFQYLKPETLTDIEVGMKSEWRMGDWRTRFNIDYYHYLYDNIIITQNIGGTSNPNGPLTPNDPSSPTSGALAVNAGQVVTDGVEWDLSVMPTDKLTINFDGAYTYAHVTKTALLIPGALNSTVNLPTPRWAFSVSGRYVLPFELWQGELALNADYFNTTAYEAQNVPIPGYNISNLRIDWSHIAGTRTQVSFWIRNLTDNHFKAGPAFPAGGIYDYAEPRMYGVDVSYKF